jgi:hypothetical protein
MNSIESRPILGGNTAQSFTTLTSLLRSPWLNVCFHKNPTLDTSQFNPIHAHKLYFEVHFTITLTVPTNTMFLK